MVSVPPCAPCSVPPVTLTFWPIVPLPDRKPRLPMVAPPSSVPVTFSRAPITSALPPSWLVTVSTPPRTRVEPANALLSAVRLSTPMPRFSNAPLPVNTPDALPSALWLKMAVPLLSRLPRIDALSPIKLPASTCVLAWVLAPDNVSVPAPSLTSAPAPETVPAKPSSVPAATLKMPFWTRETLRAESKLAVVVSVPPAIASAPPAAPRLASDATDSVPLWISVPPEYVLTPARVNVPPPVIVSRPVPPSPVEMPTSKPLESRYMPLAPSVTSPALNPWKRSACAVVARKMPPSKSTVPVAVPACRMMGPVSRTPRNAGSRP